MSETGDLAVAADNVDMAAAWDGEEGEQWAARADRYDRGGEAHTRRLLEVAAIGVDERVLDIGCGTGHTTREAARRATTGQALGVDLSAAMLDRARKAAADEGLTNVRFEQADAQVHPFPGAAFDVAISSFGAMFFGNPVAAFANVARALRPGGRLAMTAWRELERNEWLTGLRSAMAMGRDLPAPPPGAPGPFGLAAEDHVRSVLGAAGFTDVALDDNRVPMTLGADVDDAYDFVAGMGITRGLTADLDEGQRRQALDNVRALLAAQETPEGVQLSSSAWVITARVPA